MRGDPLRLALLSTNGPDQPYNGPDVNSDRSIPRLYILPHRAAIPTLQPDRK